jgi:hypothetical protein
MNNYIITKNFNLFLQFLYKKTKSIFKKIKKIIGILSKNNRKHKIFYERIQLICIYICAIVVLMYSVRTCLGDFPELFYMIIPFSEEILSAPFLRILTTPEKTYFIYVLIIEFVINRPVLKFSSLVKFNVLLILILEMVQNLIIGYWDLIFSREVEVLPGAPVYSTYATAGFFSIFLGFFLYIYVYSCIQGVQGRFPKFPGLMQKVTDSVAFWLKIRKVSKKKKDK